MISYQINAAGMAQIRQFMDEFYKSTGPLSDRAIGAWAAEAEESLINQPHAIIEISSRDSKTGAPVTLTIADEGVDVLTTDIRAAYWTDGEGDVLLSSEEHETLPDADLLAVGIATADDEAGLTYDPDEIRVGAYATQGAPERRYTLAYYRTWANA